MTDRVERYLFVFEAAGAAQVQAAMKAMGVSKAQLLGTEKEFTDAITKQSKAVEQSTSRWMKHLHWIAQGILIWEGIRVIKTVIGDWITVQKELDTELTRFRIAMGDSNEAAQEYLDTVMAISHEMRMPPGQIAGGIGIAYRAGEEDIARYAVGVSRLTGMDVTKVTQELIALKRQFSDMGMDEIMDTFASNWQESTLSAGQYFGLLESSGGLVKMFNTDLNTLLSLFTHITLEVGESGGAIERFVYQFRKFYEPGKLRAVTEQFIGPTVTYDPTTGQEMRMPIDELWQALSELNDAQLLIISQNFPGALAQKYGAWFLQVVEGFKATAVGAGAFGRAMDIMSDSFVDKASGMESAWQRFLKGFGDLGAVGTSLVLFTNILDALAESLDNPPPMDPASIMRAVITGGYRTGRDWAEEQWGAQASVGVGRGTMPGGRPITPSTAPTRPGLPPEHVVLPEGIDFGNLQGAAEYLTRAIQISAEEAGFFVQATSNVVTVTDSLGRTIGILDLGLASFEAVVAVTRDAFAELPRRFAQTTPAEWALAQQLYPKYRERYELFGVEMGERETLIGPGDEMFTGFTKPLADAMKESSVVTRAWTQATQEHIRWQERSTAAYKKGVAAWEGMITGLPGVTTPTAVTGYDLYALTPAGMYADKWDEPMRQLKQDVNDMLAGNKPEYGVIHQPWAQEIFGPIMGMMGTGTPEAKAAAGGAYEEAARQFYGLALDWSVYEPQVGTLVSGAQAWAEDRATREANVELMKQAVTDAGLGPEVLDFIEYEEMSPMAKWASGGKMPDELKEELAALGGTAAEGVSEGMLGEFKDEPWIDDAVAEWKRAASTDENISLFIGVGRIIGSNMQTGLVESIGDGIFPRVVAYIIALINEEE